MTLDRRLALVIAASVLVYLPSLRGAFISDDVTAVAENPILRSLAPENLWTIARTYDDGNWMPLKVLSLAVDQRLFGPEAWGYHLTNVLIHAANAALVYVLLAHMGEPLGLACVAALVWSLHPVQVESVAWISERKNVLSTFFFFLAMLAHLAWVARPRIGPWLGGLGAYAAALVSKVNTIVLPALALTWTATVRRLRPLDIALAVPLLAVGAFAGWMNVAGHPVHGTVYHGGTLAVTLRTSVTVIPRYLALVVDPWGTSFYHLVQLRASWLDPAVVGSVLVLAGLVIASLVLLARRRVEGFWIAWFGITLSPMLNLVPFPALMADRYLYIPLLGPVVLGARAARAVADRFALAVIVRRAVAGVVVAGLAVLTLARIPVFQDEESLVADWVLRTPYLMAGNPFPNPRRAATIRLLEARLATDPDAPIVLGNHGAFSFEEGREDLAERQLERAFALAPDDPTIATNLGRLQLRHGRIVDAVRTLEIAASIEPPSFFAQLGLAEACRAAGRTVCAEDAWERARAIRPNQHLPPYDARR